MKNVGNKKCKQYEARDSKKNYLFKIPWNFGSMIMKSSKVTSRTLVVFWSILEAWSRPVKKCRQCWSTCGGCHSKTRSIQKLTVGQWATWKQSWRSILKSCGGHIKQMRSAHYRKLSGNLLRCSVSSSTSRTAERMEAIVKKHSEIMWWSNQANESSRLRKTLWRLAS